MTDHYQHAEELLEMFLGTDLSDTDTLIEAQVSATLALVDALRSGLPVVFSNDIQEALAAMARRP